MRHRGCCRPLALSRTQPRLGTLSPVPRMPDVRERTCGWAGGARGRASTCGAPSSRVCSNVFALSILYASIACSRLHGRLRLTFGCAARVSLSVVADVVAAWVGRETELKYYPMPSGRLRPGAAAALAAEAARGYHRAAGSRGVIGSRFRAREKCDHQPT